ncbi:MAG: pyridoxal phosphate-dependent aminotransferase [Armatimonadota bacterium]|jgi:aspartate/methionine/tyrosine aminotransferase
MKPLTPHILETPVAGIKRMTDIALTMPSGRSRPPCIRLEIGDSDFDTPEHIREAGIRATREGKTHYTDKPGTMELREAIAEKLQRENGLEYRPADEICVTQGGMGSVFTALATLVAPGEEVLISDPAWPEFLGIIATTGARAVPVPVREADGFNLTAAAIEDRLTPRSKLILLNSPHNPTGGVMTRDSLAAIAELAETHDLYVLSDELYEKLIYDDAEHLSFAALPGMWERTVTTNALSKVYAMTGWRIGYSAAPRRIMEQIHKVHYYTATCCNAMAQEAALAAITGPQDCVEEMRQEFLARRDLLVAGLNEIPGFSCRPPLGAFYVFCNVGELGVPSEELALRILREAEVSTVPGVYFGANGEGFLRLTYCNSRDNIAEALRRIARLLSSAP